MSSEESESDVDNEINDERRSFVVRPLRWLSKDFKNYFVSLDRKASR